MSQAVAALPGPPLPTSDCPSLRGLSANKAHDFSAWLRQYLRVRPNKAVGAEGPDRSPSGRGPRAWLVAPAITEGPLFRRICRLPPPRFRNSTKGKLVGGKKQPTCYVRCPGHKKGIRRWRYSEVDHKRVSEIGFLIGMTAADLLVSRRGWGCLRQLFRLRACGDALLLSRRSVVHSLVSVKSCSNVGPEYEAASATRHRAGRHSQHEAGCWR
jgi:hypothetical protein